MKYSIILISLFITSCSPYYSSIEQKKPFNSKGFAYIYNEEDYESKSISKKFDNSSLEIAHNKLKQGTLIKITNLSTNDSIILKNKKKTNYPEFYKILITEPVANKINLEYEKPLVEIIEIKKNKSFIAKKTKIFNEEKKTHNNAPVENVKIDNISKNKKKDKIIKIDKFHIIIAEFYSKKSALVLKKRITEELPSLDSKKLKIKIEKSNKSSLLSGPYSSINLMKNDYILLKRFGFEELDISLDE